MDHTRICDRNLFRTSFRAPRLAPFVTFIVASLLLDVSISLGQAPAQGLFQNKVQDGIRGTVVNAITRAPIARALVYSLDNQLATLTDSNGRFAFTPPDSVTTGPEAALSPSSSTNTSFRQTSLRARRPGFLEADESPQVSPEGDVTISLVPEALIKGRITLSTNEPALGVSVQLFSVQVQDGLPRWSSGTIARANSAGEFRFAELRPGSYRLATNEYADNDPVVSFSRSQLFGFPPVYYPNTADFSSSSTIQLAAGETFQADLSLTRQPYYNVHIPVANTDAVGMNVWVRGQRGPGYSLGYNSRTESIDGNLPNGNYVVEASTFVPPAITGTANVKVDGASIDGTTMTLHPKSSIMFDVKEEFTDSTWPAPNNFTDGKGVVTLLNGPRMYLQPRLESADDFQQPFGGTGRLRLPQGPKDDSLAIEDVAPGRYWLRLSTGRGYIASATFGTFDLLHEPLVVAAGAAITVEVTMRDDFAELEGTVTNIASQSAAETTSSAKAWVYCVPLADGPGAIQTLAASPDGKFSSQNFAPGNYRILAFKKQRPNLPYRDTEAMKAYESKGQVVHLAPGQKASVQIQLISIDD